MSAAYARDVVWFDELTDIDTEVDTEVRDVMDFTDEAPTRELEPLTMAETMAGASASEIAVVAVSSAPSAGVPVARIVPVRITRELVSRGGSVRVVVR